MPSRPILPRPTAAGSARLRRVYREMIRQTPIQCGMAIDLPFLLQHLARFEVLGLNLLVYNERMISATEPVA